MPGQQDYMPMSSDITAAKVQDVAKNSEEAAKICELPTSRFHRSTYSSGLNQALVTPLDHLRIREVFHDRLSGHPTHVDPPGVIG